MFKLVIKPRPLYRDRLLVYKDNGNVKILTGLRQCGKTCILAGFNNYLVKQGVPANQVIRIDYENIDIDRSIFDSLYDYVADHAPKEQHFYLMLDEVHRVKNWEEQVNRICRDFDVDVYLAGSHVSILSEKLDAVREGRYNEIQVFPLSLGAFIQFNQFEELGADTEKPLLERRYLGTNGKTYSMMEVYLLYIKYGGIPILADIGLDVDRVRTALDGTFSSVIVRDILETEKKNNTRVITDAILLRDIINVMSQSIGKSISATWVAREVAKENGGGKEHTPATRTVEIYMKALLDAYLFYESPRFDIRSEKYLKTLSKYYLVDAGFHNYLNGLTENDYGMILENKIFFELLRRGYSVCTGKFGTEVVDFIATRNTEKLYIQVSADFDGNEKAPSLTPLRRIRNNHPKILISFYPRSTRTKDGIILMNAIEFLMGVEVTALAFSL